MRISFLIMLFFLCSCQTHQIKSDSGLTYSEIAFAFEKAGQLDKARHYYVKSTIVSPERGEVYNNYGAFLCRQGEYKESQIAFKKAISCKLYVDKQVAVENAKRCVSYQQDQK